MDSPQSVDNDLEVLELYLGGSEPSATEDAYTFWQLQEHGTWVDHNGQDIKTTVAANNKLIVQPQEYTDEISYISIDTAAERDDLFLRTILVTVLMSVCVYIARRLLARYKRRKVLNDKSKINKSTFSKNSTMLKRKLSSKDNTGKSAIRINSTNSQPQQLTKDSKGNIDAISIENSPKKPRIDDRKPLQISTVVSSELSNENTGQTSADIPDLVNENVAKTREHNNSIQLSTTSQIKTATDCTMLLVKDEPRIASQLQRESSIHQDILTHAKLIDDMLARENVSSQSLQMSIMLQSHRQHSLQLELMHQQSQQKLDAITNTKNDTKALASLRDDTMQSIQCGVLYSIVLVVLWPLKHVLQHLESIAEFESMPLLFWTIHEKICSFDNTNSATYSVESSLSPYQTALSGIFSLGSCVTNYAYLCAATVLVLTIISASRYLPSMLSTFIQVLTMLMVSHLTTRVSFFKSLFIVKSVVITGIVETVLVYMLYFYTLRQMSRKNKQNDTDKTHDNTTILAESVQVMNKTLIPGLTFAYLLYSS